MLADLVEQQTTTTGTGTYTVSGTVDYRRTFAAALATGDVIPYVCVDSSGNFECGYGTWTDAGTTLARTTITSSSNGGAAVNWAAGTKRIYLGAHSASPLGAIRHNFGAAAAPTINDDGNDGYGPGSLWYANPANAREKGWYICISAGAAAAQWAWIPVQNPYFTSGVTFLRTALADYNANATLGSVGYTFSSGLATPSGGGFAYGDAAVTGLMAQTANATATKMTSGGNAWGIYCEEASCVTLTGTVSAIDKTTSDVKSWKVEAVIKTTDASVTTLPAGAAPAVLHGDAGASGWSVAVVVDANDVTIEVTGEAATNITWSAALLVSSAAVY